MSSADEVSAEELADETSRVRVDRPGAKREHNKRAAALARLKSAKEGNALLDSDDEDAPIYEYVDEEEYKRRTREQAASDFVVDDDGRGYADDGRAWWEEDHKYSDGSEAEEDGKGRKKKSKLEKMDKGKKKAKPEKDAKQKSISSLFTSAAQKPKPAATAAETKVEESLRTNDDLNDMLNELNEDPIDTGVRDAVHRRTKEKEAKHRVMLGNAVPAPRVSATARAPAAASPSSAAPRPKPAKPASRSASPPRKLDVDISLNFDNGDGFDMGDVTDNSSVAMETDAPVAKEAPEPQAETAAGKPEEKKTIVVDYDMEDDGNLQDEDDVAAGGFDWWKIREQQGLANPPEDAAGPAVTSQESSGMHSANSNSQAGPKVLPTLVREDGTKVVRFYWVDAAEDTFKHPGTIYLFGKVKNEATGVYESCCVTVNNIERCLFFLPREKRVQRGHATDEDVTMTMVYDEARNVMKKYNIPKFLAKPVERKYAFELDDVPAKSDYLKVKYAYQSPQLPPNLAGETFSRVFGTNTGALEHFLLKRKLMGPCWLDIAGFTESSAPITWCKFEITADDPKNVVKVPQADAPAVPELRVASLSIKTVVNRATHKHEIVAVSVLTHGAVNVEGDTKDPEKQFHGYTIIRQYARDQPFPFDFRTAMAKQGVVLQTAVDERQLLSLFMAKLHKFDPDVIVGHHFFGFDLDVLLHRMKDHKIADWSKLGRLKRKEMPRLSAPGSGGEVSYAERAVLAGRLAVSMWVTSKELITKVKSYSLQELARTQLGVDAERLDFEQIPSLYGSTRGLVELVRHSENDTYLIMQLLFKLSVLPLSRQITCLAGNVWSRTLMGGRAERNEHLLLHEFHARKFIVPDKAVYGKAAAKDDDDDDEDAAPGAGAKPNKKKKAAYAGGLVLEPKRGFYDTFVLLLDFNSLYPSIIQEYNICFTTVDRKASNAEAADGAEESIPVEPDASVEQGVLPKLLANLVQRRREVKNLIKGERDPAKLSEYDIRQRALKLTANSMYGCLGFTFSRFYAKPLAALITSKGRDILENTANLARTSLNLDVIYGDTDSIMINSRTTDLAEVKKIGNQVKREVNKLYKLLEIDIDGIYKTMLLLKKKKYAALAVTERDGQLYLEKETKGLDIVRRDWCTLSQEVGNAVLNLILADTNSELLVNSIHDLLRDVGTKVRDGYYPVEKYIINKSLTKDPKDYPDKKNQPHVQVALRMRQRGQVVGSRDTIPYVICDLADKPAIADRARHPDELKGTSDLVIDVKYYLKQQLHPVVARLCEPIQGTDGRIIAECLGLDPGAYASRNDADSDVEQEWAATQISDEDRFRDVAKWRVKCPSCGVDGEYAGVVRDVQTPEGRVSECGILCPNASCRKAYPAALLCNQLTLAIRHHINEYYKGWVKCDDTACGHRTRQLSVCGPNKCNVNYCTGKVKPEYTATQLFTQLTYYQFLFDRKHARETAASANARGSAGGDRLGPEAVSALTDAYADELDKVYRHVGEYLKKNARNFVDMASIFTVCYMGIGKKSRPAAA